LISNSWRARAFELPTLVQLARRNQKRTQNLMFPQCGLISPPHVPGRNESGLTFGVLGKYACRQPHIALHFRQLAARSTVVFSRKPLGNSLRKKVP
jgi:hypothetical protein